jgi:hypothetical protein
MLRTSILALLCAVAVAGCFPDFEGVVRTRAAHDFKCTEDDVRVKNIGGSSYEAKGCGNADTYDCSGGSTMYDAVTCKPEGK